MRVTQRMRPDYLHDIIIGVGAPLAGALNNGVAGALYNNDVNNNKINHIKKKINVNNRAPIKGAPTANVRI